MNVWSGDQNSECYSNHNDNGAYPARNWGYWENFSCQGPEGEATPTTTTCTQTSNPASCWFITSGKLATSLYVQSEFQRKFMSLLIGLIPFSLIFPHFPTHATASRLEGRVCMCVWLGGCFIFACDPYPVCTCTHTVYCRANAQSSKFKSATSPVFTGDPCTVFFWPEQDSVEITG